MFGELLRGRTEKKQPDRWPLTGAASCTRRPESRARHRGRSRQRRGGGRRRGRWGGGEAGGRCWKSSREGEEERRGKLSRGKVIGLGGRSASSKNRGVRWRRGEGGGGGGVPYWGRKRWGKRWKRGARWSREMGEWRREKGKVLCGDYSWNEQHMVKVEGRPREVENMEEGSGKNGEISYKRLHFVSPFFA